MEELERSRRSRRGHAEGVAGGECERGLNPVSLVGGLGTSSENFHNLGALSCNLGKSFSLWGALSVVKLFCVHLYKTARVPRDV